ncbi:MAG: CoA pyrophosphatase [Fluviicola sp.]|nr:CoA pyrophosphatase [Fluviicola sp.]
MTAELLIASITGELAKVLPGENAHFNLAPIKRLSAKSAMAEKIDYRSSAVAIVLYSEKEKLRCILIQRPKYEGTHGGQVSFPGGKVDEIDDNLEATARRECEEEINLPFSKGELMGELSPVYIPVSNFMVQPFVFFVRNLPELSPDFREVESILHFDLEILLDDSILKRTDLRISPTLTQKNVPYFDIENKIVWGATSMILAELKEVLLRI